MSSPRRATPASGSAEDLRVTNGHGAQDDARLRLLREMLLLGFHNA